MNAIRRCTNRKFKCCFNNFFRWLQLSTKDNAVKKQPMDTDTVTLTRFVIGEQRKIPTATGDFTQLLNSIQTAVKIVDVAVRKAGITKLFGLYGARNVQGENQQKLDVLANDLFVNLLKSSFTVAALISEENDEVISIPSKDRGHYIVCFDPLDGSSNIDCSVSIGSIFGIYHRGDKKKPTKEDFLKPGRKLAAAGYALYGSATVIMITTGHGLNAFMLDHAVGEFVLTDQNVKIPDRGQIYCINEGYAKDWSDGLRQYVHEKKFPTSGEPYSQRYVGSMVADVHRTIKYGGIFMYPSTAKNPGGKLRLLYECNPLAFLVEQAGGIATNGTIPILDVVPTELHHRTPIYLGSKDDVEELLNYLKK